MKLNQLHEGRIVADEIKKGDKVITHYTEGEVSVSWETVVEQVDEDADQITFKVKGIYGVECLGVEGMTSNSFHANGKDTFDFTLSKIKFSKTASNIHAKLK